MSTNTKFNCCAAIKMFILVMVIAAILFFASGCGGSAASTASRNNAVAADNFEIPRKVFFYNGITAEYIYTMEGLCSIKDQTVQVEVTCKVGEDEAGNFLILKHLQGLSDNITYTVIQLSPIPVSTWRYRVMVRPETIIPDFELDLSIMEK